MEQVPLFEDPIERESSVEDFFTRHVEALHGISRKLKWIGRRSAPDRFITFPRTGLISPEAAGVWLVELKRPGKTPRPDQIREHRELRQYGARVIVLTSREEVLSWLASIATSKGKRELHSAT